MVPCGTTFRRNDRNSKFLKLGLHFLKRIDHGIQILDIENDGGFLAAAGLLGNLEELPVTGLLQVDIERALTSTDGDGVELLTITAVIATSATVWTALWAWCRGATKVARWSKWILATNWRTEF